MPNRNAKNGYAFECRVRKGFEKLGYFVMRSGGSRGVADLLAVDGYGRCYMIQCKRNGKISQTERDELAEVARKYGSTAVLAKMAGRAGVAVEYL